MTSGGESLEERLERLRRAAKAAITQTPSGDAPSGAPAPKPAPAQPAQRAKPASPARPDQSTQPARPASALFKRKPKTQPEDLRAFDPTSMGGALVVMGVVVGVLWLIEVFNSAAGHDFNRFGMHPRTVGGLWGIITMPFLHHSGGQLLALTLPLVALGWVMMLSGVRAFVVVTGLVIVASGVLTWLLGPGGTVVGCSALVFGWFGYILARAVFARRIVWIASAALVLVFFSSLFAGIVPVLSSGASWQPNLFGFLSGIFLGWLLHPRKSRPQRARSVS